MAQIFAKKTGLSVFEDHWMYQHPFFPFLIADVDRFVTLPDGRKAILECKTAHYDMQFKWRTAQSLATMNCRFATTCR